MASTRHHVRRDIGTGDITRIDRDECYVDRDKCTAEHVHVVAEDTLLDNTFHGHPAFTWPREG